MQVPDQSIAIPFIKYDVESAGFQIAPEAVEFLS
jgi:hypothetical protein